jgi:hypothetical protein
VAAEAGAGGDTADAAPPLPPRDVAVEPVPSAPAGGDTAPAAASAAGLEVTTDVAVPAGSVTLCPGRDFDVGAWRVVGAVDAVGAGAEVGTAAKVGTAAMVGAVGSVGVVDGAGTSPTAGAVDDWAVAASVGPGGADWVVGRLEPGVPAASP